MTLQDRAPGPQRTPRYGSNTERQRTRDHCDHAAGIRVSAISAYQLEPKGIALSSKL